ncbi:vWA domain-containing protein [Caldalkalibacillus mannanilyticus]|uniref:vWA domain-containing protein n=1 Tax=Caldalkalibacillus mannanilyticus TaxID=1418 RepID=UPI0004694ECF|nr:hypothetical protein [Caldalkalibacillus mannanilyticus]
MKFLSFVENDFDAFLHMQLEDLAQTLSRNREIKVDYSLLSYYDPWQNKVFASRFWDKLPQHDKKMGLLSDVYLASLGQYSFTQFEPIATYKEACKKSTKPRFAIQLLALCEELRLLEHCQTLRKGMHSAFLKRKEIYRKHYAEQMSSFLVQKHLADALLCALYCYSVDEDPLSLHFSPEIEDILSLLMHEWMTVYEASSTQELVDFCLSLMNRLEFLLPTDSYSDLFILFSNDNYVSSGEKHTEGNRVDPLKNIDKNPESPEDSLNAEDKLPTWHRETSQPTQSFLQFELEQGTQMQMLGDAARQSETDDQAMGSVQGKTGKAEQNDFSKQVLDEMLTHASEVKEHPYGKANAFAALVSVQAEKPTVEEQELYRGLVANIFGVKENIRQSILKTLEFKRNAPRQDLYWGRLDKKIIRLLTEEHPRLFYKKQHPSSKIDAVFSLLIDCSASMYNKMDETKKGVTLFHEVLRGLAIPHSITGFWEDVNQVKEEYYPTYFQKVISFENALSKDAGAGIVQLKAMEDNRDGFAIRHTVKELLHRSEKHRFLFVFSDGSPSAAQYDNNGILDTYQAVLEARKKGVTVIGLFLANGEINETDRETMSNIYGKQHILVENVGQLPEHLTSLLKKVIFRSI